MSSGNFLFFLLMLMGPLISVSSSNWLICWVGVEITFLGLIPLMISSENSFFNLSKESSMKYFCIQALGSGLLLCSGILVFNLWLDLGSFPYFLFLFSLLIKLGVFPAHFWVPSVVSGLSVFPGLFMVLTWQKVVPFFLLINLMESCSFLSDLGLILGGTSAVIGAVIGLNQTQLSPMLGASSITHGGWLMLGSVYGSLWLYFFLYCVSFSFLIYFMMTKDKLMSGFMLLSLSGLPPFIMFIGKWCVLNSTLFMGGSFWYLILPLLGSVMSLFFYLKFFYSFYMEEGSRKVKVKSLVVMSVSTLIGLIYLVVF